MAIKRYSLFFKTQKFGWLVDRRIIVRLAEVNLKQTSEKRSGQTGLRSKVRDVYAMHTFKVGKREAAVLISSFKVLRVQK